MEARQLLIEISKAKQEIIKAEDAKCICSGFVLQYEGSCQCEARFALSRAKSSFWDSIDKIESVLK